MNKKYWFSAVFLMAVPAIIVFLILVNIIPLNISDEACLSFLGSYLGGGVTLAGVFLSIQYSVSSSKKSADTLKEADLEKKRLQIKPYLETNIYHPRPPVEITEKDTIVRMVEDTVQEFGCSLRREEKRDIKGDWNPNINVFAYSLENVGNASAVNMYIHINDFPDNDAETFRYALKSGEKVIYYFFIDMKDRKEIAIYINIEFDDIETIGHYKQSDIIKAFFEDDNRLVKYELHEPSRKVN